VKVITAGGTAQTLTYTYLAAPGPITIDPDSGPETGGNLITVTGSGLAATTAVTFEPVPPGTGGGPAFFDVLDDNTLTVQVPPGAGTAQVTVTTPGGTSTVPYTYLPTPGA